MNKDEVWDRLKKESETVYGQSMLDMFLKTTEDLERRHWDELDTRQRKLVNPEIKLKLAITPGEAERAIKDGAKDLDGALNSAAYRGHVEICRLLIEKGAKDLDRALINAAQGGHVEICRFLIEKGAKDLNEALYSAAKGGHVEVCRLLIDKGAKNLDWALNSASSPKVRELLLRAKEKNEQG